MADTRINGVAIGVVTVGGLFVYAGIKGYSIPATIQDIVTGKSPLNQSQTTAITGTVLSISGGSTFSGSNSQIANDAMKYVGHAYLYGGSPGTSGSQPWDCSSFVNWVLGHDLGVTLPGGIRGYNGTSHGPPTGSYLLWGGATRIPRNQVQAGDICVNASHMGIATSNTEFVSALNPSLGTRVEPLSGFSFVYMRVK